MHYFYFGSLRTIYQSALSLLLYNFHHYYGNVEHPISCQEHRNDKVHFDSYTHPFNCLIANMIPRAELVAANAVPAISRVSLVNRRPRETLASSPNMSLYCRSRSSRLILSLSSLSDILETLSLFLVDLGDVSLSILLACLIRSEPESITLFERSISSLTQRLGSGL